MFKRIKWRGNNIQKVKGQLRCELSRHSETGIVRNASYTPGFPTASLSSLLLFFSCFRFIQYILCDVSLMFSLCVCDNSSFFLFRWPLKTLSVSLCTRSGQTGGGATVRSDLPAVPRGRGVHDRERGVLRRGAGTRQQTTRGQDLCVCVGGGGWMVSCQITFLIFNILFTKWLKIVISQMN